MDSCPAPPVLYDHLAPNTQQQPPYVPPQQVPQPSSRGTSNLTNPQPTTNPQQHRYSTLPIKNTDHYMPTHNGQHHHIQTVNGSQQVTTAFDMYIPTHNSAHLANHHPSRCSCCPHHHKRRDANRVLYRHMREPTWWERIKDNCYRAYHFASMTYWHLEPWLIRPILAGLAYNMGVQVARVLIQYFFPSYFPTTVYFPLRANAKSFMIYMQKVSNIN
eukprot:UN01789